MIEGHIKISSLKIIDKDLFSKLQILLRRKRTAFSPATTLALEQFANSINWKRGESEKINEFAQKHNLTFYQVKVDIIYKIYCVHCRHN